MKRLAYIFMLMAMLTSCSVQKWIDGKFGRGSASKATIDTAVYDLGRSAMAGINHDVPAITYQLIKSLKNAADTLDPLDPLTRKIKRQIDSLGHLTNTQVDSIAETVIAKVVKLKGEIKDDQLKQFFLDAITKAGTTLDRKTRNLLANMIGSAVDRLNTDDTRQKLASVRDSLLNPATQHKLQETVRLSLQPTIDTLTNRIARIVHEDLPTVQKYATQFLIALGLIMSAIIALVWYQRRRYLRLVQVLTNQIHQIPQKSEYDRVVGHIQRQAQLENLEPLLRDVLKDQGIN
ncbi:hypothetical protein [Spirosoma pollinicola]|uniref:Lipoprotein n=1 Tax=Spirosoma pollinicola TaxID=2057025 RepID=A0A2K8Z8C5_9BACT|nr:hypothetical protein [Spirosoma pollinicola]AUD06127.1 hypothetical protein CWM47_32350 [Spirosoma pollinicola]